MDRRIQDELLEVLDALREQVGPDGLIVPLGSVRYHPSAIVVSGFAYPLGLVARAFGDLETGHADLSSPKVLVYNGVLFESAQLQQGLAPVLEQLISSEPRLPLAIFALDLDGAVLDALVNAHRRKMCISAAIGCLGLEQGTASYYLHTIARICGATVVGPEAHEGQSWMNSLGSAERILTDRHRTVIIGPTQIDQSETTAQPIGLLSVGGNDVHEMRESIEWIESLIH